MKKSEQSLRDLWVSQDKREREKGRGRGEGKRMVKTKHELKDKMTGRIDR